MLKAYKVIILFLYVAAALASIGYNLGEGVTVSGGAGLLKSGGLISDVDGKPIKSVSGWYAAVSTGETHFVTFNGNSYELPGAALKNITVKGLERNNLDLGIDLQGGTRVLLKPVEKLSPETVNNAVIPVLQTRINAYGLQEIVLRSECDIDNCFVVVEIAGESKDTMERLLASRGNFEAKIPREIKLFGGKGSFSVGAGNVHTVEKAGDKIKFGPESADVLSQGGVIKLDGVDHEIMNYTDSSVFLSATVLKGDDIENVFTDSTRSVIQRVGGGYRFAFSILISKDGAARFAQVTSEVGTDPLRQGYLKYPIILYLDNKPVTELSIAADLAGRVLTEISIEGFRETRPEAISERSALQSILKAGALPVGLEITNIESVSPTLGIGFIDSAVKSALFAVAGVALVVMARYRSFKIALPMVLTSLGEVIILLGVSARGNDVPWIIALFAGLAVVSMAYRKKMHVDFLDLLGVLLIPLIAVFFSWTIDLAVIAGIIAFIGTGISQMIIISDEVNRTRLIPISAWEKIKRAFSIVFASAITVVSAMFALLFIGVGLVKGFAITTIVGVLIGVLITRPAYSQIVEIVLSGKK
ncbi:MAG: MMPL family transporter [Candidatus Aenigmarchaeota archaeon]|nr:MMPL family transporter [Candidatus Aenigmarchaeota archaeon]